MLYCCEPSVSTRFTVANARVPEHIGHEKTFPSHGLVVESYCRGRLAGLNYITEEPSVRLVKFDPAFCHDTARLAYLFVAASSCPQLSPWNIGLLCCSGYIYVEYSSRECGALSI